LDGAVASANEDARTAQLDHGNNLIRCETIQCMFGFGNRLHGSALLSYYPQS
jgi:hypothetical protein